jgi:hypothetical protein
LSVHDKNFERYRVKPKSSLCFHRHDLKKKNNFRRINQLSRRSYGQTGCFRIQKTLYPSECANFQGGLIN